MNNDVRSQYGLLRNEPRAEDVILPRDIFSSPFRYELGMRKGFFLCFSMAIVLICVFTSWLMIGGLHSLPYMGLLFTLAISGPVLGVMNTKVKNDPTVKYNRENALGFLKEVVTIQPGLDGKKWDFIAARLNKMFHANNNAITPYFFYDGDECHSLFMSWYYNPTVKSYWNCQ